MYNNGYFIELLWGIVLMYLNHQGPAKKNVLNVLLRDFPGGPMVKNLPCNAGDAGLIPGQGTKIPHAVR